MFYPTCMHAQDMNGKSQVICIIILIWCVTVNFIVFMVQVYVLSPVVFSNALLLSTNKLVTYHLCHTNLGYFMSSTVSFSNPLLVIITLVIQYYFPILYFYHLLIIITLVIIILVISCLQYYFPILYFYHLLVIITLVIIILVIQYFLQFSISITS